MNPKQFLLIGGVVLILIAILGFAHVIGPTADDSIFGPNWWFDNGENWAHLVLGIVAIIAAFAIPAKMQKPLVVLLGIVGIVVGLWSLVIGPEFLGANLENPADTVLHVVVGIWALWAGLNKKGMMGGSMKGPAMTSSQ
jgi:hypothetical protein